MLERSTSRKTGWLAPLCCSALGVPIANADVTFVVDTIDDRLDDDCSDGDCHTSVNTCGLRAAIMQANHLSAPARTTGGHCDAGAFEYDGFAPPQIMFESGFA